MRRPTRAAAMATLVLAGLLLPAAASTIPTTYEVPELVGNWWQIAPDEPDVAPYTYCRTLNSSAVDFTIFRAADGSWRLVSCVRNICELTGNRLLHEWSSPDLTATFWTPVGILGHSHTIGACAVDPNCTNSVRAPHGFLHDGLYYLFFDSGGARCLIGNDGINWTRHVNTAGDYKFFNMGRDLNVTYLAGRWQAVFLNNPDTVHPGSAYMGGRTAPTPEGPWSDPPVVVRSEGNPESPFILEKGGLYYLWQQEQVFVSTDPLDFDGRSPIASMWEYKYAPEVFQHEGQWYVAAYSNGIWLSRMRWVAGTPAPLAITTTTLPDGQVGVPYAATCTATGGTTTVTWTLAAGTPPPGLTLSAAGTLSGTPTTAGPATFTVRATAGTETAEREFTVDVTSLHPPEDPTAVRTGPATVLLAWTNRAVGATGLRIERRPVTTGSSDPVEIIIDNAHPGVVTQGSWRSINFGSGYWGADFLTSNADPVAWARWPVDPGAAAGEFDLSIRHGINWSHLSAAVPVTITHAGGTTAVTLDQTTGGGTWVPLGTFTFADGHHVAMSADLAAGRPAFDAIRLFRTGGTAPWTAVADDVAPATRTWEDTAAPEATAFEYRLTVLGAGGRAGPPTGAVPVTGPLAPLALWTLLHLGDLPPALQDPLADVEGDGLANAAEFGLGGDPRRADAAVAPRLVVLPGGGLALRFHRAQPSALRYTLQGGPAPGAWTDVETWPPETLAPATLDVPLAPPVPPASFWRLVMEAP